MKKVSKVLFMLCMVFAMCAPVMAGSGTFVKTIRMSLSDTVQLHVNTSRYVEWYSSNNNIVRVNSNGRVTPYNVGTSYVWARVSNGNRYKWKVVVSGRYYGDDYYYYDGGYYYDDPYYDGRYYDGYYDGDYYYYNGRYYDTYNGANIFVSNLHPGNVGRNKNAVLFYLQRLYYRNNHMIAEGFFTNGRPARAYYWKNRRVTIYDQNKNKLCSKKFNISLNIPGYGYQYATLDFGPSYVNYHNYNFRRMTYYYAKFTGGYVAYR